MDANGKVAEGLRALTVQVLENLKTALAAVHATIVLKISDAVLVKGYMSDRQAVCDVWRCRGNKRHVAK